MEDFNPSFFVILTSLAGVLSVKRLMEGSPHEVPVFFHSAQGRTTIVILGGYFLISFITVFIEGFMNVTWWFPILLYVGAAVVVNFLPYTRMSPESEVFEPAIGVVLYSLLSVPFLLWFIVYWVAA